MAIARATDSRSADEVVSKTLEAQFPYNQCDFRHANVNNSLQ